MGQNELITGWVYKQGELVRQRIHQRNMLIAVIASIALSLLAAWPIMNWGYLLKGKIGGWIFVINFILLAVIINFLLKIFSGTVFRIYKKLFKIKEEEIIFTNYKISSTNKTWILNDDSNKLISVSFSADTKPPGLTFRGTTSRTGKTAGNYSIDIPVPYGEMMNAEKICNYFNSSRLS